MRVRVLDMSVSCDSIVKHEFVRVVIVGVVTLKIP